MIKHFLKVFFASAFLISFILSVTSLGYIFFVDKDVVIGTIKLPESNLPEKLKFYESSTYDYNTTLGIAAKDKKRFNILVVGLEGLRTDTIMVASYDMESKTAELVSVPRDTYLPRNADDSPDLKKINALYSREGIEALVKSIEDLLGIPLEKYVLVDYDAVISCVDLLGGVEVDVPFHMVYSDPYDDPPLYIDIPEGIQVLDGKQSLNFLRYRKGYANQDLGRIEAQQQFIKSAMKKAMGLKLPALIKEAYSNIDTNVNITDVLGLANDMVGFSTDNINVRTLPGEETTLEGLSFYIPDESGIAEMMDGIYGIADVEMQN
ncbi:MULTISPECIES: LCP family protein [unclassified Sedimentibacter]|uniref:LCP family protein n=1 Tax=unclassified Sedimentibacter TaxID=2649220 RepID=UPI0027DEBE5C|nr:LCP family protein [Sedimentibacter sp. MB35-C1]WMJ77155.1 LCP family protein [Sedimentibacter sp. MB35-C1]